MPFFLIPVSPSTFSTTDCPCGKSCAESLYCGRECAIRDTGKCLSPAECYYRTSVLLELIRHSSFDCIQDANFPPLSADYSAVSGCRPRSEDFADWNDIERDRESQAFSWSSLFRRTSASLRKQRSTSESSEAPVQSSDRPRDTAATSIAPSNPIRILMHTKAYTNVKRATTLFTCDRVHSAPVRVSIGPPFLSPTHLPPLDTSIDPFPCQGLLEMKTFSIFATGYASSPSSLQRIFASDTNMFELGGEDGIVGDGVYIL
jgi:hypothetical protein